MERTASPRNRMPRDVPLTSSITPLRASAWRCSSAALADLNPSSAAISARVGGAPVRAMAVWMRSRICCWRAVSFGLSSMVGSGGTIAGTSAQAGDNIGYTAAQVGVGQLLAAVPGLQQAARGVLVAEQVAQIDSKDMDGQGGQGGGGAGGRP